MIINGDTLLMLSPIKDMLTKKHKTNGVTHGLSEAGYDIRIKQNIMFTQRRIATANGIETKMVAIDDSGKTIGSKFCLASAIEEFSMPTNLVGIVHDKSTWARQGLSVFNTVIEPGWSGWLTLELMYHGDHELVINAGSGIAQVVFHTTSDSMQYNGKYQNQEDRPVEAIAS